MNTTKLTAQECVDRVFQCLPKNHGANARIEDFVRDMHSMDIEFRSIVFLATRELFCLCLMPRSTTMAEQPFATNLVGEEELAGDTLTHANDAGVIESSNDHAVPAVNEEDLPPRFEEFDPALWEKIAAAVGSAYPDLELSEWRKLFKTFLHNPNMTIREAVNSVSPPLQHRGRRHYP